MIAYRKDIDGLRAIAVISVILFHASLIKAGYLGVDIFFVISGYIITSIIYKELIENKFSITKFYERRIRRILPLSLVVSLLCLAICFFIMLPDDFENFCQSVIATTLFSNNILLYLTSGYWDIVNEYKPLMHTWSLGVEEQFYFLFPIILFVTYKVNKQKHFMLKVLGLLIFASLALNFIVKSEVANFFFVSSRFYQLGFGCFLAVLQSNEKKQNNLQKSPLINAILVIILVAFLIYPFKTQSIYLNIAVTVITGLVLFGYNPRFIKFFLENRIIVFVGKISYSLYMWHHAVFAIARQTFFEEITIPNFLLLLAITFLLSYLSYLFIENYFRNKKNVSYAKVLVFVSAIGILLLASSFYFYKNKGVVRDVPELNITKNSKIKESYKAYTDSVYLLDKPFTSNKIHLLVIGSSFARDFVNMLQENGYTDSIEIVYKYDLFDKGIETIVKQSDAIIMGSVIDSSLLTRFKINYSIDQDIVVVGNKNFGVHNGLVFNKFNKSHIMNL